MIDFLEKLIRTGHWPSAGARPEGSSTRPRRVNEDDQGIRAVQQKVAIVDRSGSARIHGQRFGQFAVVLIAVEVSHIERQWQLRGERAGCGGIGQGGGETTLTVDTGTDFSAEYQAAMDLQSR